MCCCFESNKAFRTSALGFRIILFANLMATMIYGAVTPSEMVKVTAERVTLAITGVSMAAQLYATLARFSCLPYSFWAILGFDGICAAGWCAALAAMSYWDRAVVYKPRAGDPAAWFKWANHRNSDTVLSDDGYGQWIHITWCKVVVNGQDRLVGNGAARLQLHVLIGLSTVSLLFTGFTLWWTVRSAQYLGLIRKRNQTVV
ncbi:uncharacterized protein TRUGW13939_06933 [Talaromyces rugulosus]|uniref:MARVEL domain-containing protein n=1 Tax=Talaromyces rugulosus TaxID=121627 RepID=A0A7H8R2E9_TALRU|nr:uncharacterized protein TRUGW13939_06933 [Talaromyces rugulosus]QKX59791.1 hypothetical protein TRUGW13939_06933 [Talaromyces rugulosus]